MSVLGFNLQKGELHFCLLDGRRTAPRYLLHDRHRFNPDQSKPELANFFKQTFNELFEAHQPGAFAYRLTMDAKKADQLAYLVFPFGILNLIAYERGIESTQSTLHTFTKKALGYQGDKFSACDAKIADCPASWTNPAKLAALSAWISLQ